MSTDTRLLIAASVVLQQLHDEMAADHFTLGWLMHSLHKRSFGIIMLLIARVAIVPRLSIVAGLLLLIPTFQMIAGKSAPVFRAASPRVHCRPDTLLWWCSISCWCSGILRR